MRQFTDKAITTAKEGTHEAIEKLANLRPTENFTLGDIRQAMFYLKDYLDELEKLERQRNKK